MNNLILVIILLVIISILLVISIFLFYKNRQDILKHNKNLERLISSSYRDFQKDIVFLERCIDVNFEYVKNTILSSLNDKRKEGFLKDEDAKDLTISLVENISKELSEDYKLYISFYIDDLTYYITKRISYKLTPYLIANNLRKIKNFNI